MSAHASLAQLVPEEPHLNFEHQRKRARTLLKAVRAREPEALRRLAAAHPGITSNSATTTAAAISLHDAQLVIAREQGFASWARLKAHLLAHRTMSPLGATSLIGAANRALESELPRPLYRDPLAGELAGEDGRAALASMRSAMWPGYFTGPDSYITIRTRFFDDALRRVVHESSITQVMIVGAGMDTRAFRLDWPAGVACFEVDRDEVIDRKEIVLRRLEARAGCHRRSVKADLSRSWGRALIRAGFDPARKSAILLESVLQYLDRATVERVFQELRRLAASGSWIGIDVLSADTLESEFMAPYLRKLEALGLPPSMFGVNDPEAFLAQHGWKATSVVAGAPEANFGRWPYGYIPRGTPGIPRAFLTQGWMVDGGRR